MFNLTDPRATSRNLDALIAALDQSPTGLLRTLLRLLKRYYERNVPANDAILTSQWREIGIQAERTGYCLECGTYHNGAKAVQQ